MIRKALSCVTRILVSPCVQLGHFFHLLAICIQHEMDHLVGKLFVDYLSPLKRQRIRQKMEKMAKLNARAD